MSYRVIYEDSDGEVNAVDITASGTGTLDVKTEGSLLVFYDESDDSDVHIFRHGDVLNYTEL